MRAMLKNLVFSKELSFVCKKKYISIFERLISHNKWLKYNMPGKNIPPHRDNPVIMKLDSPEFKSIFSPELITLSDMFKKYNYEIRIAGGAVRDMLMGINPKDLDFATTATPDQMKEMFTKEEIRLINTNGEKHGTITARINDKENYEVTTLRVDVVTDGRHAEVMFTTDWLLDSNRRDLTINSMFLDLDGNVYDYFYGYDDLLKRRIVFVGDPADRIREDFLRILRYFRFYGRISEVPDNHDDQTIKAIKENADGLQRVSGERIWGEWSKILQGKFYGEITNKIIDCDCGKYIGLPENVNLKHFNEICLNVQKNNVKLRPISLVVALLHTVEEVISLFMRLRFSAFERELALFIVSQRDKQSDENPLKRFQRLVLKTSKSLETREFVCELLKYKGDLDLLQQFEKWDSKFPIGGRMIEPYVINQKMTGIVLSKLKDVYVDNDCEISVEKLQTYIPQFAEEAKKEFEEVMKKRKMENIKKGGKKNAKLNIKL